ncbi:MAG: J domain-containing protein [Salinirussus sp.]
MAETYYERLGIGPDATTEEVERAYRERLKEVHPDVSDDPQAATRTRELLEAKRVLTDADERAVYDRVGHASYTGTTPNRAGASTAPSEPTDVGTHQPSEPTSAAARERERRRRRNRETRAAWNPRGGAADGGAYASEWRTWDTDGAYRIHPADASRLGRRLFPIGPSVVTLVVAFLVYPVLLWGVLQPAFPLPFNVVLAGCLLLLVGYLSSMPPIGAVVFGIWTVILPPLAVWSGVGLASPAMLAVFAGTAMPLALSLSIMAVLRS